MDGLVQVALRRQQKQQQQQLRQQDPSLQPTRLSTKPFGLFYNQGLEGPIHNV